MRRIAYASVAMLALAVGIGLVIPGRWTKPNARSILIGVAQAMENAKSIHVVGRGSAPAKDAPSGTRMMPQTMEIWLTPRTGYVRITEPDGTLAVATALDADSLKWWEYESDKGILYVADLAPMARRATEAIAWAHRMWLSAFVKGQFTELAAEAFPDAKQHVAIETRDGRKVAIVTVTATVKTLPQRVTNRWLFEVDADTNHVLTMRQYARAEGAEEELIARLDKIEYDVPLPAVASGLDVPEGTKTVAATAEIQESNSLLTLIMKAGDKEIGRLDIQPGKS